MKTSLILTTCAFVAVLSGCARIEEAAMPVAAKVNAAYPFPPEVQAARERLLGLLADDAKQADTVRGQMDSRTTLRALSCSQQVSISRLASVASVRALGLDQACFQTQDLAMQAFLGVRTIGQLMSRPPLRPLKQVGLSSPLPKGTLGSINYGTFASNAGVAVLRDVTGDATVVELPSGAVIAKLPRMMTSSWASHLSPNGRVLALQQPMGQGVTFYDTSNGHRIWDVPSSQNLLTWLPDVTGFLLAERDGATTLADGLTGTLVQHPLAARNASFAANLPGSPARTLLGSGRELVLMEHQRTPAGLQATEVRKLRITDGSGITSGHPVPMQQGKLVVFASSPHIGWLNLESGESGIWRTSPTFGATFAKLDESRLLVDSLDLTNRIRSNPWVFDVTTQAVAPIDSAGMWGLLIQTGDRPGFMRRGQEAWIADEVKTTREPVPLDQVAGEYELQVQLTKLQAQAESRQVPAATTPYEHAAAAAAEAARAAGAAARGTGTQAPLGLPGLPRDAMVHMVGVYEGTGSTRATRTIRVIVRPSPRPLVLALSSYESVRWIVVNTGARISAVVVSGYEPSTVIGLSDVPVMRMGTTYAYKVGSAEHMRWRQEVQQYVGPLEIRTFQGQYSGAEFSVGGS